MKSLYEPRRNGGFITLPHVRSRALSLDATLAYPSRKRRFVNLTRRKREYCERGVGLRCRQAITIECKEQAGRQKFRAFVVIDKSVIFG